MTGELADAGLGEGRAKEAAELFEAGALAGTMPELLTIGAYERID